MNRKWLGLMFWGLATLLCLQSASAVVADVAYILKDGTSISGTILQEFNSLNLSYNVIRNSQIPSTNFSNYNFVVIGENVGNSNLIPFGQISAIFFNKETAQDAWNIENNIGSSTNKNMRVTNFTSFIYTGVTINPATNDVQVYTTSKKIDYLKTPTPIGVINVGIYPGQNSKKTISYSTKNVGGKTVKSLFFGAPETNYWNADGQKIFKNSLVWVLQGLDQDRDGWIYGEDCNDNNSSIHPNATEIPYDGIDQNCDGIDLTDVDGDGYDSDTVGGLDCDDNDPIINPSNPDPLLNCINDAPIIFPIASIIVNEGETVVIEVEASDPDLDDLTYSINDPRFEVDGNVLTWQTNGNSHGNYNFVVTASDGELSANTVAYVSVINQNFPSIFSGPIPDLVWEEDTSTSINLSQYFDDEDGNEIWFGIENTSNDDGIAVNLDSRNGIVNFTTKENWFGSDWIVFYATDGVSNKTISNIVTLTVMPINDAVTLKENIPNITFNEDNALENALDLNDYFEDVDSELDFEVFGNANVSVEIVGGVVSFHPAHDFYGTEEIYFVANDGEYSATSNTVLLTVNAQGEPPEFLDLNCNTELAEDAAETCTLEAWDLENDTFTFSVSHEDNLNCEINGNELTYVSAENYFGNASCTLVVSDIDGETSIDLNVNISPVNDAPEINSYLPNEDVVTMIESFSKEFSIEASDIDSEELNVTWFLDGTLVLEETGSTSDYLFNKSPGSYSLEAIVSDGAFMVNRNWRVVVGPLGDFTCSEVGGHLLEESQTCNGTLLGVKDSTVCCSLPGIPAFNDADSCGLRDENISINIEELNDEIYLGDTLKVEVKLKNDYDRDQNLNVETHLYDIDRDESMASVNTDVKINEGSSKTVKMDLLIPADLDIENNHFALFVKAEDDVCNQGYRMITLKRSDNKIFVKEFNLPSVVSCGEKVHANLEIENVGSKNQDVLLSLKNSKLKISETLDEFRLKKFGDDEDSKKMSFDFVIPNNAISERYEFAINLEYGSEEESIKKEVRVECATESEEDDNTEPLNTKLTLNEATTIDNKTEQTIGKNNSNSALISIMSSMELVLICGLGITYLVSRKSKKR